MRSRFMRRAFGDGFAAGFTSPFAVFLPDAPRYSYRHCDSVARAWREVGDDLAEAMKDEERRIVEVSAGRQDARPAARRSWESRRMSRLK